MKTKFGTKLVSLLLCICMLVPMFAACGNKDDETPLSWEATEDQVISLEMEIQNGDSNTTLVLTYGEDIFSSIENEQIKLTVYQKAADESAEEAITDREVTNFTAKVDNAKQLSVTVPKTEGDWGYLVAVHSSAISSGKFGEAWGFDSEVIEEYISYSASISGEYATGDVNPVITVTLENTVASAGLTKDMITLTGLFGDLEITSVSGSESTITIVTNGTIAVGTSFFAGVKLAGSATNSGVELTADCEVAYRSAYVKQDSFALASGVLTFDVVITSDTVTLAKNDTLTADGITYTVKAVSEDKTTVTLGVATTASDLDSAIAEINGKALEIPANKTASATANTIVIYAIGASIGGSVDYIEETGTANTYSATALLFVKNGVWNSTLSVSDITLGGDFEGATVTSVTKDGDTYEVVFTFVKEGLDLDDLALTGSLNVAADKVKNTWGTTLVESEAELTYVTGLDRGETWDAIKAFIDANKGTFDTISTVGSAVSGVVGAVNGVMTILELTGVVEGTDAKLDKIKKQLEDVQQSIAALDVKLDKIGNALSAGTAENLSATQYNTYLTASGHWNNFVSSYVVPLTNEVSEYQTAYNAYMLSYIANAHNVNGEITVYIDANQNVTLPHPSNNMNDTNSKKYSIDGTVLSSYNTCRLSEQLEGVYGKVMQNKGRLYDGYWDDIEQEVGTIVDSNGTPMTAITKEDYLLSVRMEAALYALEIANATDILNAYVNFCNALAGQGTNAALKPLDNYFAMLSMYYNFYMEAESDIETTLAWLGSVLIDASGIATLAYDYTPSAQQNLVKNAYERAANKLSSVDYKKSDYYCYIAGKTLSVSEITQSQENGWWYTDLTVKLDGKTMWPDALKQGSYMTETQVLLMIKRFNNLKSSGATTATTFRDYLISIGLIKRDRLYDNKGNAVDTHIFVSNIDWPGIQKNNSVSYPIVYVEDSTWYKVGDSCSIGSHGDVDADYFDRAEWRRGDAVDLNGNVTHDLVLRAVARYSEEHWYWSTDENWWMIHRLPGNAFVFTLS